MLLQRSETRVGHRVGLAARVQGEVQRGTFRRGVERAVRIAPHGSQFLVRHTKVLRPQQRVGLAVKTTAGLAGQMAYQAAQAKVHFAGWVHHGCIQLREGLHQPGLALHGQHAVGRETQRAQEEVEMVLEFGGGVRAERRESWHGVSFSLVGLLEAKITRADTRQWANWWSGFAATRRWPTTALQQPSGMPAGVGNRINTALQAGCRSQRIGPVARTGTAQVTPDKVAWRKFQTNQDAISVPKAVVTSRSAHQRARQARNSLAGKGLLMK